MGKTYRYRSHHNPRTQQEKIELVEELLNNALEDRKAKHKQRVVVEVEDPTMDGGGLTTEDE